MGIKKPSRAAAGADVRIGCGHGSGHRQPEVQTGVREFVQSLSNFWHIAFGGTDQAERVPKRCNSKARAQMYGLRTGRYQKRTKHEVECAHLSPGLPRELREGFDRGHGTYARLRWEDADRRHVRVAMCPACSGWDAGVERVYSDGAVRFSGRRVACAGWQRSVGRLQKAQPAVAGPT
jgi:hypothetical protein